jgi:hypothetical protein
MLENLRQFSYEPIPEFDADPNFTDQEIQFPLRKCHGWIKIPKDKLPSDFNSAAQNAPKQIRQCLDSFIAYFAIVYEYMPKSRPEDQLKGFENLESTLKVLRWAGFTCWDCRKVDWIDGRLADQGADIDNANYYKRRSPFRPPRHEAKTFFQC